MKPGTIYRKTPEGEEALKARTRLRSGRLRAVLIVVDGQASADELVAKLGKKCRPRERLIQLERLGLIEPIPEKADGPAPAVATTAEGPRLEAALVSPPFDNGMVAPAAGERGPAAEGPPQATAVADEAAHEGMVEVAPDRSQAAQQPAPVAADGPEPGEDEAQLPINHFAADQLEAEPGLAGSWRRRWAPPLARLGQALARPQWQRAWSAAVAQARMRLRGPRQLGRKTWFRLGLAAPLLLAATAWLLLTGEGTRLGIERHATAILGQTVRIQELGLELRPRPDLALRSVTVGEAGLARAAVVRIAPSFHSVSDLARPTVDLKVEGLQLSAGAVAAFCSMRAIDPARAHASRIDTVQISDLDLVLPRAAVAGLRADISLNPDRGNPTVTLSDAEEKLRLDLSPTGKGCRFTANGTGWRLPFAAGTVFDSIEAHGTIDENGMHVADYDGRSLDGRISGAGTLSWGSRVVLELELELRHVALAKLLSSLGVAPAARGELDGSMQLSASAADLTALPDALAGTGTIAASRGAIDRFDLMEAARNPGTGRVFGGTTRFEQASARLQFARGTVALQDLRLQAGALTSDGTVSIDRREALRGTLTVHLQNAGERISVPLRLGGSVGAPQLAAGERSPGASSRLPR
ncbi:MAG: AsmA-like C-terminal region-containing protein [Thiohalocapsa sp.]